MSRVEILEVLRPPVDADRFWGASIDRPVTGQQHDQYAFVVAGWALHRGADRLDVEVVSEGRVVGHLRPSLPRPDLALAFPHVPASVTSGFIGVVRTLDLPPQFELKVEGVEDEKRTLLGVIRGRRSALIGSAEQEAGFVPVITLGRTGSTLLMLLLAQHPGIVVQPPFPYEARVVAYWASILHGLSSPASYLQAVASIDGGPYWWVGQTTFSTETYLEHDLAARRLGGAALEATAAFARRQVASFYEGSSSLQGKTTGAGRYFAEKQLPCPVFQRIQSELFPGRREIYLVRDFRDMIASILAFNRKRDHAGFGRDPNQDDMQYVTAQGRSATVMLEAWRNAGPQRLMVRYEDLVREPGATLERILFFLNLERSDAVIEAMRRQADNVEPEAQRTHATSADALASIGRWKRDLSPELRDCCRAVFGEALTAFGYEL